MSKQTIILLGHGSRSKDATDDFNYIVDSMNERLGTKTVHGAHMELAKPSLEEVVAELAAKTNNIKIVPYFLYKGIHIKEDIPEIIESLEKEYPNLSIELDAPIGKDPMMVDLILGRLA